MAIKIPGQYAMLFLSIWLRKKPLYDPPIPKNLREHEEDICVILGTIGREILQNISDELIYRLDDCRPKITHRATATEYDLFVYHLLQYI